MNKIIIVSGPVIVKDDKVLLDKDRKDDFWKFCGGKVKEDEGLVDTAKRRSEEELGIDIELLDEAPYMNFTKKETGDESIDVVLAHFLASAVGEIKPGAEIREWKWVPLSELKNEPLAPNIIPTLRHFGFIE